MAHCRGTSVVGLTHLRGGDQDVGGSGGHHRSRGKAARVVVQSSIDRVYTSWRRSRLAMIRVEVRVEDTESLRDEASSDRMMVSVRMQLKPGLPPRLRPTSQWESHLPMCKLLAQQALARAPFESMPAGDEWRRVQNMTAVAT